ncbi:hypothetical protein Q8W37_11340 [Shimia thalassica]|jgi:hypothetical protein|nr:hypothetical protein [Shimia thalassica]MBU2941845.1 hypothetical protein [Shimia thalassica]MDO6480936.1 hypothetical protein [Shimia thalassica]MDO6483585.1 hypothetical protein [Shimia thalassica]MDO6503773.1 hypothetical protein [Shimia thalassica]MDO6521226.1 hypothetical protein [Shimia thalassica]
MGRLITMVSAAVVLSGATMASAQTLNCSFPNQKLDGWIRGQVILKSDTNFESATIFDSLINQVHSEPIPARISANNDKRLTAKWQLKQVQLRDSFAPKMSYTLTFQKETGSASINATAPVFHDNNNADRAGGNFGARGSCKLR